MRSLGANHGTSSHIRDLKIKYMIASVANDGEKMEAMLNAIRRSKYAESTKIAAIRFLAKWEENRENS